MWNHWRRCLGRQVRVLDGEPEGTLCLRGDQLYTRRLLGTAVLPLSHIQVRDWDARR